MGARAALVGDRHQLPAVGRGGVLDIAARWVTPEAHVDLDIVHRFADPGYAAISLALRTGSATYSVSGEESGERVGEVWGALLRRDQVRIRQSGSTHPVAG
ncbi:MAG: AAA family ATPase [Nocardioidaceae bacterium]